MYDVYVNECVCVCVWCVRCVWVLGGSMGICVWYMCGIMCEECTYVCVCVYR